MFKKKEGKEKKSCFEKKAISCGDQKGWDSPGQKLGKLYKGIFFFFFHFQMNLFLASRTNKKVTHIYEASYNTLIHVLCIFLKHLSPQTCLCGRNIQNIYFEKSIGHYLWLNSIPLRIHITLRFSIHHQLKSTEAIPIS